MSGFNIQQVNEDVPLNTKYNIQTICGICTMMIDSPVTRSSLLYENQSILLQLGFIPSLSSVHRRSDITYFLHQNETPALAIFRGFPFLIANTFISNIIQYICDKYYEKYFGNKMKIMDENLLQIEGHPEMKNEYEIEIEHENGNENDLQINENMDENDLIQFTSNYCYSISMNIYNQIRLQNIMHNSVIDNDDRNDRNAIKQYEHQKRKLIGNIYHRLWKKIAITSICSLITYPLYTTYVRLAFDVKMQSNEDYSLWQRMKSMVSYGGQGSFYDGFIMHITHDIFYHAIVSNVRLLCILYSPQIHTLSYVNKLWNTSDPFEFAMCLWWLPPFLAHICLYPLLFIRNEMIFCGSISDVYEMHQMQNTSVLLFVKSFFQGLLSNSSRFMLDIQICELSFDFFVFVFLCICVWLLNDSWIMESYSQRISFTIFSITLYSRS